MAWERVTRHDVLRAIPSTTGRAQRSSSLSTVSLLPRFMNWSWMNAVTRRSRSWGLLISLPLGNSLALATLRAGRPVPLRPGKLGFSSVKKRRPRVKLS